MDEKLDLVQKVKNDEIDFMILIQKLWNGRKTILIFIIIGASLGLIIAIFSPKQYTVITTMLPQSESENNMSKISSLVSIAGFDLDLSDAGSDISPVVYPQIVESVPFLLKLMNSPFTFSKVDHQVSLFDYYTKIEKPGVLGTIMKYTVGLPGLIIDSRRKAPNVKITSDSLTRLTKEEDLIGKYLKENVKLTLNKKEGYLTLTCTFPEALLTAQVAKKSQEMLQQTIIEYKTKRAIEQLKYIEQQYAEKKINYKVSQTKLASYKDRNQFVSMAMAGTTQERLEGEYNIAYSVYSELAKQLENAKMKVKKETPAFVILKPVVVPYKKTKPQRIMILFIWTIVSGVLGAGWVFGKTYIAKTKRNQNIYTMEEPLKKG